jgi:hypothetical protein
VRFHPIIGGRHGGGSYIIRAIGTDEHGRAAVWLDGKADPADPRAVSEYETKLDTRVRPPYRPHYCAVCGVERLSDGKECPNCGRTVTTTEPPSQEPCAYCGERPTWPVTWSGDGQETTLFLCAKCDEQETDEVTCNE